jgi:hypothetical protein
MTDVTSSDAAFPGLLRHIRDEMTVQLGHSQQRVAAGEGPDHCEQWVQAVQDGAESLSQSKAISSILKLDNRSCGDFVGESGVAVFLGPGDGPRLWVSRPREGSVGWRAHWSP